MLDDMQQGTAPERYEGQTLTHAVRRRDEANAPTMRSWRGRFQRQNDRSQTFPDRDCTTRAGVLTAESAQLAGR